MRSLGTPLQIIHIYHLACMGFRFIVHPNWYVVSLLHPPSQSWREALGPDRISGLFHKTKLLYENAKIEIRNGEFVNKHMLFESSA